VVTDYERSFVGAFATSLIEQYLQDSPYELYFTVAKFENNLGFTLIQTNEMDEDENEENRADNEQGEQGTSQAEVNDDEEIGAGGTHGRNENRADSAL